MRFAWRCGIGAVMVGALVAVPARGQVLFDDVFVEALPAPDVGSGHGYQNVWVAVTNHSPHVPHRVTLTVPRNHFRVESEHQNRREVVVQPRSTAHVRLMESVRPSDNGIVVAIDGRVQLQIVAENFYSRTSAFGNTNSRTSRSSFSSPRHAVWVSPAAAEPLRQANGGQVGIPGRGDVQWLVSNEPATAWGTHWLGYSAFDGVIVTRDDMTAMPPAVRAALWRYVDCGGALLIVGAWEVPDYWKSRRWGVGALSVYFVGFGQCLVLAGKDLTLSGRERAGAISAAVSATGGPFRSLRTVAEANREFPVVPDDELAIPVQGLFTLMVLFVVVIGPVNLFVLSRLGHRLWLLWTVPAIALVTCLGVFAYVVATEGWRSRVRTEGLTVLDEHSGRAASIGWTALYCPVTPEGLHFGYDTELTPHRKSLTLRSSAVTDWTDDQHLVGWVVPRLPLHFQQRTCTDQAARVTVRKTPTGQRLLVNGLPAAVRTVTVADTRGRLFTAADVPAGGEGPLTAAGTTARPTPADVLRHVYQSNWLEYLDRLRTEPQRFLLPGCYLATLDAAPFLEGGLRDAGTRRESSVVYGIMKEPVDEN